jgi:hypothetical protein
MPSGVEISWSPFWWCSLVAGLLFPGLLFITGENHGLKNRLVFMKIREIGLDRFHWFLINRPVNLFFKNFDFF